MINCNVAAGHDSMLQQKIDYLAPNSTVFNIGGHKGGFVQFAAKYPVQVHVFEPA